MKRCNGCGQEKSIDEFYRQRDSGPNGLKYKCISCYNDDVRALREVKRKIINEAKDQPCADCGETYPSHVMQFDHIVDDKEFYIGRRGTNVSISRLQAEIAKCEVVCANCHANRTYCRAQGLMTGVT